MFPGDLAHTSISKPTPEDTVLTGDRGCHWNQAAGGSGNWPGGAFESLAIPLIQVHFRGAMLFRQSVARRELIPETIHDTSQYANNRAELSHQPTRVRERGMRRFKSSHQAQRFLAVHSAVYNLFNLGRHLISAEHYRTLRQGAFVSWEKATMA